MQLTIDHDDKTNLRIYYKAGSNEVEETWVEIIVASQSCNTLQKV